VLPKWAKLNCRCWAKPECQNHESLLEDTHKFTSQFLHTDGTIPAKIASSAQIRPHYTEMDNLLTKYKVIFGIK
jgi:hypothetical protein